MARTHELLYVEKKPNRPSSGSGRLGETPDELATLAIGAMRGGVGLLFREDSYPVFNALAFPYNVLPIKSPSTKLRVDSLITNYMPDAIFAEDTVIARFGVSSSEDIPQKRLEEVMDKVMSGVEFVPLRKK
jgi:hypothetical protein